MIKELNGIPPDELLASNSFTIQYGRPNPYIYKFQGQIERRTDKVLTPINSNSFVLRGCSLRNTDWVVGVVCYTGHETKIMLNSAKSIPKHSSVENLMNQFIVLIFLLQLFICLATAYYAETWNVSNIEHLGYLYKRDIPAKAVSIKNYFIIYGSWVLIFTNFVPISLVVTLELVKFIQGSVISEDRSCVSG
jgi:phospholipid-transporting ATPase